ncbi:MAG: glycerol-3-phosphate 1-O-acyltransferase PlsY [Puniceicoccales bacterium]|jgi:glycerol-3-phosphate acyltransferase PlsY|nr:glycerol-3-phosphate 1-O-acyltransferase PlsY [Puniceicoccales bacterium]
MFYFWIFLGGYFLGSIPFGFIIAKARGIDILQAGSGNPGATNVKRVMGKKYGILVFFLDCFKSLLPIAAVKIYLQAYPELANNIGALLLVALVLGHCCSIFLKFRGGKGVATTIGGLAILMPTITLLGIILWYCVFTITRVVSLASLCFALSLPLNAYLFAYQKEIIWLAFLLMVAIFFRHISNIRRLWNGAENRFDRKNNP